VRRPHLIALAALFFAARTALPVAQADTKAPANVIAIQIYGNVSVAHGKAALPVPVKDNDALAAGDIVETAVRSGVVLVLPNGSTISLNEKSRLAITVALQSPFAAPDLVVYDNTKTEPSTSSTSLDLKFGEVVAWVRKLLPGSDFSIKTPAGQSTVKGTEFEVAYTEDPTGEASCRLSTASGLVVFAPLEGAPVEATANRQIEVRGRRDKNGLKLFPVQARALSAEVRARIQARNQTAGRDVPRVLQQAKARRDANKPGEPARKPDAKPAGQSTQVKPANPEARHPAPPPRPERKKPEPPRRD
jgi:hypothetical protein